MLLIKLDELLKSIDLQKKIIENIKKGSIFIYPTDTVYGLGCDAQIVRAVKKLRELKKAEHPLSVIAPSIEWIKRNFEIKFSSYFKLLPGPYTLILKKKDPDFLKWVSHTDSLGIRIPDHYFTVFVQRAGVPFITTSVNVSGKPYAKDVHEVEKSILKGVDVIIDAGRIEGKPSKVIDLTGSKPKISRE